MGREMRVEDEDEDGMGGSGSGRECECEWGRECENVETQEWGCRKERVGQCVEIEAGLYTHRQGPSSGSNV